MHVLTAPHVQIVASKSILSKDCDTFVRLSMLNLFTFSDLNFNLYLYDATKRIPTIMSEVTNAKFCPEKPVRTTRLSYLRRLVHVR